MNKILEGRIKGANSQGYGFIETKERIDFFFHHTQFLGDWKQLLKRYVSGELIIVQFENDDAAPSGPRALKVQYKDSLGA